MRTKFVKTTLMLVGILILLTGCTGQAPVLPTAVPTQVIDLAATANALRTEVAGEIAAQLTSTALAMPTNTEVPTATAIPDTATPAPSLTPSVATATAIPTIRIITVYPTFTPTVGPYQCQVTNQSIGYGMKIGRGNEFDGRWTIKNTGTKDWNAGTADLVYISGTKMQKRGDSYDIDKGLDTGDSMDVIVDMFAPRDTGFYHADWAVRMDGTVMCYLAVDIWVVNQ